VVLKVLVGAVPVISAQEPEFVCQETPPDDYVRAVTHIASRSAKYNTASVGDTFSDMRVEMGRFFCLVAV